jgi:acyl-coenzyme A thioesterase PaaI-like protein
MQEKIQSSYLAASEARIRVASLIRNLGHQIVAHEISDDLFNELSDTLEQFLVKISNQPSRSRAIAEMKKARFSQVPQDGQSVDHYPDCVVSGPANPLGIAARAWRDKDEAVVKVTLGSAFEGAPGRAHGGVVAALFDDTMGFVLSILQTPAFTARLNISYLAPTPINSEIEIRAKVTNIDGRKISMQAKARHQEKVVAEADALFIAVSPEQFASVS